MFNNVERRGKYNQYHSSIKLFIASGGNIALAYDLGVPSSTLSSWKSADFSRLITHPVAGSAKNDLLLFQKFIKNKSAMRLFNAYVSVSETFHFILRSVTDDSSKLMCVQIRN